MTETGKTVTKSIGIHFGILCDPLEKQLKDQGLKFKKQDVQEFQEYMDAIEHLRCGLLLPEGQVEKIRLRLHRKIVSHVAKCEKLKIKK